MYFSVVYGLFITVTSCDFVILCCHLLLFLPGISKVILVKIIVTVSLELMLFVQLG